MGFLYIDITGQDTSSNKYEVLIKGISLGIIIKKDNVWLALRSGSKTYEANTFFDKADAAKYLAELAKVDWQN